MAVTIRMADAQTVVVEGTLAEVRERLIANWATLADFKVNGRGHEVIVNTQQITCLVEGAPERPVTVT